LGKASVGGPADLIAGYPYDEGPSFEPHRRKSVRLVFSAVKDLTIKGGALGK